jgi:hypothetical protein
MMHDFEKGVTEGGWRIPSLGAKKPGLYLSFCLLPFRTMVE